MNTLFSILSANLLISLLSFVGIITVSTTFFKTKKATQLLIGFSAGVLLATAFLDILPEALDGIDAQHALSWAMMGMISAFFMERSLLWYHHHHEDSHDIQPTAFLILVGDAIHNFIDGLAIAASFLANPALGVTTVIAIIAHEVPQELADFSVLRHCGMDQRKALIWNFISGLTSIVGGLTGYYLFQSAPTSIYSMLAVTAGLFMYISSADLIPELHQSGVRSGWLAQSCMFLLGIGIIVVTAHMF